MPRPRRIDDRVKHLIALLHAEGRPNKAIGDKLHLSESAVSKTLRECYREGLLRVEFHSGGLPSGEIERLRAEAGLDNQFTARLSRLRKDPAAAVLQPEVMVFDSGSTATTHQAWLERLDRFARPASQEVLKLILRSRVVGTSWGRTLATIFRAIREAPPRLKHAPIRFVPLCGEMLEGPPRKTSASSLAYRLDELFNRDLPHAQAHWLAGVPSHLPVPGTANRLTRHDAEVIAKYVRSLPAYRDVFASTRGQPPLVDHVDMILTSCSPSDQPLGQEGKRCLAAIGIRPEEAPKLLAGDFSGNLLPRPGIDREGAKKVRLANEAWLGARLDHIRRCAARAAEFALPGVVLCGIGANKAETVREIVRLGLANRILIDNDCWNALETIL